MAFTEERRRVGSRLGVLQLGAVIIFSILAISFWFIQVVQHQKYEEMAENNHQRTLSLRAPRGLLYDRNGRVLVDNRNSYTIAISREHSKDLGNTIEALAGVLGIDAAPMKQIADRAIRRGDPKYRPIVVIEDASDAQVAAVMARRLELPEIEINEVPTRKYPEAMAAHLFGYVGQVSDAQLAVNPDLQSGDIVGQSIRLCFDRPPALVKGFATASLVFWLCVVTTGRWMAYI